MSENGKVRTLRVGDVSAAFQLSAQAGWNQTEEDWLTLLNLAPETCFAVELDGQLASTTTLLCYQRRLAWLGMVLTKGEFQRRGFARRLLCETLLRADALGIETIKLDATDQGQPLYEQFGFRCEQVIERWSRPGLESATLPTPGTFPAVWRERDSQFFGADRIDLLERLAARNSFWATDQSYLFARTGRFSPYLGPCVSDSRQAAEELFNRCVESARGNWTWDLFPRNTSAVAIARNLGFEPQRRLLRMVRGKDLPENTHAIYAIAGFELG